MFGRRAQDHHEEDNSNSRLDIYLPPEGEAQAELETDSLITNLLGNAVGSSGGHGEHQSNLLHASTPYTQNLQDPQPSWSDMQPGTSRGTIHQYASYATNNQPHYQYSNQHQGQRTTVLRQYPYQGSFNPHGGPPPHALGPSGATLQAIQASPNYAPRYQHIPQQDTQPAGQQHEDLINDSMPKLHPEFPLARQPSTTHAYPAINGHPQIVHIQISLPMVAPTGETNAVAPVTAGVKQKGRTAEPRKMFERCQFCRLFYPNIYNADIYAPVLEGEIKVKLYMCKKCTIFFNDNKNKRKWGSRLLKPAAEQEADPLPPCVGQCERSKCEHCAFTRYCTIWAEAVEVYNASTGGVNTASHSPIRPEVHLIRKIIAVGPRDIDLSMMDAYTVLMAFGMVRSTAGYEVYSDGRIKDVIKEVDEKMAMKQVLEMNFSYYKEYAEKCGVDPNQVFIGTLAQKLKELLPEAVNDPGNGRLLTMNYNV